MGAKTTPIAIVLAICFALGPGIQVLGRMPPQSNQQPVIAPPIKPSPEEIELREAMQVYDYNKIKSIILRAGDQGPNLASSKLSLAVVLGSRERPPSTKMLDMLIEHGARFDLARYKRDLFRTAVDYYFPHVFESLVRAGCDLNKSTEPLGLSNVEYISQKRDIKTLRGFFAEGASVNFQPVDNAHPGPDKSPGSNYHKKTALHIVAWNGWTEGAKILFEFGADANAMATPAATPLHIAAASPNGYKVIPLLLKHGAKTNIKDWQGLTPLQIAEKKGRDSAVKLLRKAENGGKSL